MSKAASNFAEVSEWDGEFSERGRGFCRQGGDYNQEIRLADETMATPDTFANRLVPAG